MKKIILLLMLCLPMIVSAGCTGSWANPSLQASLIMSNVESAVEAVPLATPTPESRPTRVPVPFQATATSAPNDGVTLDEELVDRIRQRFASDQPTPVPAGPCRYLTVAKASLILGAAAELDEDEADACSYIPASLPLGDDEMAFVGLAFYRGADAVDLVESIIVDLEADSRRLDRSVQRRIDTAFDDEDFGAALTLLPELAVEPESLFVTVRPDLGAGVVGVDWVADGMYIRALLGAPQIGELILLIATYPQPPDDRLVQPALDAVILSLIAPDRSTADNTISPEPSLSAEERLAACYNVTTAQVEAVLNEPVTPETTIDEQYGYCVFTSVEHSNIPAAPDTMPIYGPVGGGSYLALSVWPVGAATDPIMYLSFAVLDRSHSRLGEFLPLLGSAGALEELAETESAMPGLNRRFVSDVGDGAFWYWQDLPSGHHLAGIYVLNGGKRVVLQAILDPERVEEDAFVAIRDLARLLTED